MIIFEVFIMIRYRYATLKDLDLLVQIRLRDLKLFSKKEVKKETIKQIRNFYHDGLCNQTCMTLLGYDQDILIATGTLYFYPVIPSNNNITGIMGQITNIYVDKAYRHQGIASYIIKTLILKGQDQTDCFCLNASKEALPLYQKLGFQVKDNYMIYQKDG